MKWGGIDSASPTSDVPGAMTYVQNTRMTVQGELRRRRGMARASLAKASLPITAIADFALSPGNPYALTYVSGGINGDVGISSLWGDAALSAVSGTSFSAGTSYTLSLARGASQFATSIVVFAKAGQYPTDASQGTFVSETTINPWDTTANASWTAPELGSWYFRAYPVRDRVLGPGTNLAPLSIPSGATVSCTLTVSGFAYSVLTLSSPALYTVNNSSTNPIFNIGAALAAGAISLPYSFTLSSLAAGPGGGIPPILQAQASYAVAVGTPKVLSPFYVAGVIGTFTANANLTAALV